MSEISATSTASEATQVKSSPSEQARIRKERREAKIRAGGNVRLNKITGLGGVQRDSVLQSIPSTNSKSEITNNYDVPTRPSLPSDEKNTAPAKATEYKKNTMNQVLTDDLHLINAPSNLSSHNFPTSFEDVSHFANTPSDENPMMKILQEMMGGIGSERPGPMPQMPDPINQENVSPSSYVKSWRIIHAVFALSLGVYIAVTTEFTGSKLDRKGLAQEYTNMYSNVPILRLNYFYIFLTAEAILISSRYLFNREEVQFGAIGSFFMKFLSEPYKNYVQVFMRYVNIWSIISQDAMVCIFVLGTYAWWNDALDT